MEQLLHVGSMREAALGSVRVQLLLETALDPDSTLHCYLTIPQQSQCRSARAGGWLDPVLGFCCISVMQAEEGEA